jgi:hypothetical protein
MAGEFPRKPKQSTILLTLIQAQKQIGRTRTIFYRVNIGFAFALESSLSPYLELS